MGMLARIYFASWKHNWSVANGKFVDERLVTCLMSDAEKVKEDERQISI